MPKMFKKELHLKVLAGEKAELNVLFRLFFN